MTPPSGWTLRDSYLPNVAFNTDSQTISVYTKTATGSEPADYTWTQATSARICGYVAAIDGNNPRIISVSEGYGNGTTASIGTVNNKLSLLAATWIYAETLTPETYSMTGAGVVEITDNPTNGARMSGGYTVQGGTVTSTHLTPDANYNPNHGIISIDVVNYSSINDNDDVDTETTPPTDGQVLTWVDANSQWEPVDASGGTVTSIDVAGGTGLSSSGGPISDSGTITLNLDDTAVIPGSYSSANITVDAQGRITAAVDGSADGAAGRGDGGDFDTGVAGSAFVVGVYGGGDFDTGADDSPVELMSGGGGPDGGLFT